jgi:DNA-binding transcriptional MerR regulator
MKPKLFSTGIRFFYLLTAGAIMLLLASVVEPRPAAAGIEVDCEGSARAYKAQGIPCWCDNGQIKCKRSSSGSSSKKGLSGKNQMKLQMLQGALDGFANAFIRWLNSPPPAPKGPTPEEIAAEKEKWERAQAEWRAKVQQQINEMEAQYDEMKRQEVKEKKAKLLAGMKGMPAMDQLSCAAYWAKMADEALRNGDEKSAGIYNGYAANPSSAPMAECNNALPQPPMPPSASEIRSELFEMVIEEINIRLPEIEKAKVKQREAGQRVAEKQKKVDELKNKKAAVSPEEKQAGDDLLEAAMRELDDANKLKKEADDGLQKLQAELNALNEAGKMTADTPK